MVKNYKGYFITFEGIDGSGKSTQIAKLQGYIEAKGYDSYVTREPGGTPFAERIRDLILAKDSGNVYPMTELLLYLASRYQHTQEVILPKLKEGLVVISDRYADSSIAYQGGGRELGTEDVIELNSIVTSGVEPDITFLLRVSPAVGLKRLGDSGEVKDRLEDQPLKFYQDISDAYDILARKFSERIKTINGDRAVDDVWDEIEGYVKEMIN